MHKTRATCEILSLLHLNTLTLCYMTRSDALLNVCLEHGMSADYKPSYPGMMDTLLELAICDNKVKRVSLLIRYHANVNVHNGSPIWYAVYHNNSSIVSMLIEAGANVNSRAIGTALVHSRFSIVLQLLQTGQGLPVTALLLARNSNVDSVEKVAYINACQKSSANSFAYQVQ